MSEAKGGGKRPRSPAEPDHDLRWRPDDRRGGVCGYTFRGVTCPKKGAHYCQPRADRATGFFPNLLVHVKGPMARQRFQLTSWQEHDIVRPLFGEAIYSPEWERYVRRHRIGIIVLGRKNGKSELLSGTAIQLTIGDDEEAAEVYGAAKDTKQAGKVFEPAQRMVSLSPHLRKRLVYNKNARRLYDDRTASYYETITADALGQLGHNPHGFILDEALSQQDDSLWNAMRTGSGARTQPLFLCITTETSDESSFGAALIDEAERIQEDPSRAPHILAYVRKIPRTDEELDRLRRLFPNHPDVPVSTDVWDEANWRWPNPALDDFLSREALRQEALEAANDPSKENAFRQFRANQRVQQVTRYLPLDLWDANIGEVAANPDWLLPKLSGRKCWGGLDLSARLDLTAWCLLFEDGWCWWRFWCPEALVPTLDRHTGGQFSAWQSAGWVTVTEGDAIDYERIYADIEADHARFAIAEVTYDRWSGEPVAQEITRRTGLTMVESMTTYDRMTASMKELTRGLKGREFAHGGNPVARWNVDCLRAKSPTDDPERVRPVKPDRGTSAARIDGVVAHLLAISGQLRQPEVLPEPNIF